MADDQYDPLSCDYHEQLELAAMHKREVELEFDLQGAPKRERGRVDDVFTSNGAEYVRFKGAEGPLEIRLDRIISMLEE